MINISLEPKQYISFTNLLEDLKIYFIQEYNQYIDFISKLTKYIMMNIIMLIIMKI